MSIKITFEGNMSDLETSLKDQLMYTSLVLKRIDDTNAYINSDDCKSLFDDISYLKNTILKGGVKLIDCSLQERPVDITPNYDLIKEPSNNQVKEDDIVDNSHELTTSKIIEPVVTPVPVSVQFNKKELKDNVDKAVSDAILNSKTPLSTEDPFYYITRPEFLLYSTFAISALLFVTNLF